MRIALLLSLVLATPALAQQTSFPATLTGHAALPAQTLIAPPADAPRDPDFKVPFRTAHEGSDTRYLTGADFDPDSIQVINDEIWIGEEFGPRLFSAARTIKRVVLIDTATLDADGFVRRIGHIDLMDIADPDGKARLTTVANRDLAGKMTMPFFTIEDVMRVDDTTIMVGNDNNLPYSSGRSLNAASDNEVLLLDVKDFLAAN